MHLGHGMKQVFEEKPKVSFNTSYTIIILTLLLLSRIIGDQRFFELKILSYGFLIISIAIFFVYIVHRKKIKFQFFTYYISSFIPIYIVISIINGSIGYNTQGLLYEIARYSIFIILAIFTYNYLVISHFIKLYTYIYIAVLIVAALQIIKLIPDYHGRIDSVLGHPNGLGNFIAISIPFFLYIKYIGLKVSNKIILAGLVIILFTGSRTAIALCAVSTYIIFYKLFLNKRIIRITLLQKIILLTFTAIIAYVFKDRFFGEIYYLLDSETSVVSMVKEKELAGSLTWRFYNWYMLIAYSLSNNFLFGHGVAYTEILNQTITGHRLQAHNDYIKYLFETGLVGSIMIVAVQALFTIKLCRLKIANSAVYPFYVFFIVFSIAKFFDGLEQSNILMMVLVIWGSLTLKLSR